MNACLEPGAVEQSSYSVNIQIQKTADGWLAGAGASDLRVAVCG